MGRRVVANHQQVRCCVPADFNADSFWEMILRALELAPPTPEENAQPLQWSVSNAITVQMSRMVMGAYEKLTAPGGGVIARCC
jgi:hypothetical protein